MLPLVVAPIPLFCKVAAKEQPGSLPVRLPACQPTHLPACCSGFVTTEPRYPYVSGRTNHDGSCDASGLINVPSGDRVSLASPGYAYLQQWSAAALREVRPPGLLCCALWSARCGLRAAATRSK